MIKILGRQGVLKLAAMIGVDPALDGLTRTGRMGVGTSAEGIDGLTRMPEYAEIRIVFDASSAGAHADQAEVLARDGKQVIDMAPAALGPYCVPSVNLDAHLDAPNLNMVTCGGQASSPVVATIAGVARAVAQHKSMSSPRRRRMVRLSTMGWPSPESCRSSRAAKHARQRLRIMNGWSRAGSCLRWPSPSGRSSSGVQVSLNK